MKKIELKWNNQETVVVDYPKEMELYYKFIYKYETLVSARISDNEIYNLVNPKSSLAFAKTLTRIKNFVDLHGPGDNKEIRQLLRKSCSDDWFTNELRLERATNNETKLHCLLRHFRNAIAHAYYNDSEERIEITDKEETGRLTAYGFIDKELFIEFVKSFTD